MDDEGDRAARVRWPRLDDQDVLPISLSLSHDLESCAPYGREERYPDMPALMIE